MILNNRVEQIVHTRGGIEFTDLVLQLFSENTELKSEEIALACSALCGNRKLFFITAEYQGKIKKYLFPMETKIDIHKLEVV